MSKLREDKLAKVKTLCNKADARAPIEGVDLKKDEEKEEKKRTERIWSKARFQTCCSKLPNQNPVMDKIHF